MYCEKISQSTTLALKGIAIVFVVFGHLGIVPLGGAIGVEIFLVLSGYGIHQSYLNKSFDGYWKNKIKKIWTPFFIWELIVFTIYYITDLKNIRCYNIIQLTTSVVGINSYNVIDKTMWYIPYLFTEYLLFWLVFRRKNNGLKTIIIFIGYTFLISCLAFLGMFPRYTGVWIYTFGMPIGIFYSYVVQKIKLSKYYLIAFLVLIFWPIAEKNVFLYCLFITGVGMMVPICSNIITKYNLNLDIWEGIGKISFYIYLCEAVIIDTVSNFFPNVRKGVIDFLIIGFIVIVSIGISLIEQRFKRNLEVKR